MTDNNNGLASRVDRLPQRTRRIVAVATLLGLPGMYAWSSYWEGTEVPTALWGPISFVFIGITVVGALVLYRFVRNRADLPGGGLDERERHLRDQAFVGSYVVLSSVVVVAVGVLAILVMGMGSTIVLDGAAVSAMAITVGTLIPVLPVAALAWIEPDVPADD